MNNPFKSAKDFISRYKKEEWFRAVAVIVIVTALAAVGYGYRQWQEDKENPPEQSLRPNRRKDLYLKISGMTASCILLCLRRCRLLSLLLNIIRAG